ncbi:hypothetical protein CVT24_002384, partial [Panaeolus cyanescens]
PTEPARTTGAKRTSSTNIQTARDGSQPYTKPPKGANQNPKDQESEEGHPPLHPSKLKKKTRLRNQEKPKPETLEETTGQSRNRRAPDTNEGCESNTQTPEAYGMEQDEPHPAHVPNSGGYTQEELYMPEHNYNMSWDGTHRKTAPMSEDEDMYVKEYSPSERKRDNRPRNDDPFLTETPTKPSSNPNLFRNMSAPYTQNPHATHGRHNTRTPIPSKGKNRQEPQEQSDEDSDEEMQGPGPKTRETEWATSQRPALTQFPNLDRLAALNRMKNERSQKKAEEETSNPFIEIPEESREVMINDETLYEAISMDTLTRWSKANKIGIIAVVYGARPQLNGYMTSKAISITVKLELRRTFPEETAAPEICQPTLKDSYEYSNYIPAFPFYVTNITEKQALHLLDIGIRATQEHAVMFFPTRSSIPKQIFCLQHYNEEPTDEGRTKVEEMVKDCIRGHLETKVKAYIEEYYEKILYRPHETVDEIFEAMMATIKAKSFVIRNDTKSRPIFSINMDPPTVNPSTHDELLAILRSIEYSSYKGIASILPTFNCNGPELANKERRKSAQTARGKTPETQQHRHPLARPQPGLPKSGTFVLIPQSTPQLTTAQQSAHGVWDKTHLLRNLVAIWASNATTTNKQNQNPPDEVAEHGTRSLLPEARGSELSTAQPASNDHNGEIGSRSPKNQIRRQQPQNRDIHTATQEQRQLPETRPQTPTHQNNNNTPATPNTPGQRKKRKRKPHRRSTRTRAYMKIGTLNMNGGGSRATEGKWENINQIVRDEHLDVLVLQETHLTTEKMIDLCTRYPRLYIINTHDPEQTNAKGVAIVLNKHRTRWREIHATEIAEGRAVLVEVPWKQNESIKILGVYAPNETDLQEEYWNKMSEFFEKDKSISPDIMMGDLNIVENKIDRHPPHRDATAATESLHNFRMEHNLQDSWRHKNPDKLEYTYTQFQNKKPKSLSRIDRIYLNRDKVENCYAWESKYTGIKTDHKLVTVKIENPSMPFIGKGRWAMPNSVIKNEQLTSSIKEAGRLAHEEAKTNTQEIQKIHGAFKKKIQNQIREYMRVAIPKLHRLRDQKQKEIKELLTRAERLQQGEESNEYPHLMASAASKEEELREISAQIHHKKRDEIAAKFWKEGEVIGKAWINVNKEIEPRDTIYRLKKPGTNPPEYVTKSEEMAELAKEYHDKLQSAGLTGTENETRWEEESCLNKIKSALSQTEKELMDEELTTGDIIRAIKDLPNGKAPGLDGLTTELYKKLIEDHERESKNEDENEGNTPAFNIAEYLKLIFNDIARNGPHQESDFAEGWMCPLYKKNDRTEVENYRPITVLNTDYKIMTRALTTKLGQVAPSIIHPDQAGFMKEPLAELIRTSELQGFKIDEDGEIKVSLFADDTTVYLTKDNDIKDLFEILEKWCEESGAKFNKNKTKIIPMGKRKYRETLRTNRKMGEGHEEINKDIKIAEEGQPTRVLGTWHSYKMGKRTPDARREKANSGHVCTRNDTISSKSTRNVRTSGN